ncbi:hypothetical protein MLD24_21290 [Marinobacter xestospongiae]|nr:hypothetical protein [Marinobacter xestospongiae]
MMQLIIGCTATNLPPLRGSKLARELGVRELCMTIQDSSPERRNLIVISVGIIAFFVGEASIPADEIRLGIVSVTFSRPDALIIMLWLIFLWFLYRYWVVHRSSFGKEFPPELNSFKNSLLVRNFVESRVGQNLAIEVGEPNLKEQGLEIEWLRWREGGLEARVLERTLNRDEDGVVRGRGVVNGGSHSLVRFDGFRGWLVTLRVIAICLFSKPSFTSYVVPFCIATLAAMIGACSVAF